MPTLLAIIPHPDDEAYSFAGLIALASRAGWRCLVHCASSGERGKRHDGGDPGAEALARTREAELAASCAILGAEAPVLWRLPDGALTGAAEGAGLARRALGESTPDLVLTLGPDGAYGHPDHLAVHRWVRDAWLAGRPRRPALLFAAFPPGLFLPQYEKCLGMMGDPPQPPREAIGAATIDYSLATRSVAALKGAAIAAHRSQLPGGEPEALFPPGIVPVLLEVERFSDAGGLRQPAVQERLDALEAARPRGP